MQIKCTSFADNEPIPQAFTNRGEGKSPTLLIRNVPDGTAHLLLWVHDPDAVHGDFTHWTVWNIPADTAKLEECCLPLAAVEGANGTGKAEYIPPSPPAGTGTHHYIFELFALSEELPVQPGAEPADILAAAKGCTLAHASITGIVNA